MLSSLQLSFIAIAPPKFRHPCPVPLFVVLASHEQQPCSISSPFLKLQNWALMKPAKATWMFCSSVLLASTRKHVVNITTSLYVTCAPHAQLLVTQQHSPHLVYHRPVLRQFLPFFDKLFCENWQGRLDHEWLSLEFIETCAVLILEKKGWNMNQ